MTKICKRCSKKEAEYCETCMNEENEQYMRLSDLRNNTIVIDRDELENVIMEPIFEEPIDAPVDEPVDEPIIVPIDEPVEEPVIVPVDEPVEEPIIVPVDEPVIVPVVQVDEPILVPVEEPVIVPVEEPVIVPVEEPVIVPVEEPILVPVEEPVIVPVEEPVVQEQVVPVEEPPDTNVSPRQLFTIYESNVNDNALYIANTIITQPDITVDNSTNTTDIERKLHNNPPFFLDMNIPKNELTHPINELNHLINETPKKKKKHKK